MGLKTGQVMAYSSRSKRCRLCDSPRGKENINQNKAHDCRKSHKGSSKIMEIEVACQLFKEAPKNNVKLSKLKIPFYTSMYPEPTDQVPQQFCPFTKGN